MKINAIKGIGNNKYKLIIGDSKYTIYDTVLIEFSLLKPRDITQLELDKIIELNEYYALYNKIIKYITFKLRTEKEVKNKLYTYGASKQNINKIINKLQEEGYLNNNNYLVSYINDQILLTLNGPNKIKLNLIKQGFNEMDIIAELNRKDSEIWLKKAQKIINKRINSYNKDSKRNFIIKLKAYLINLGYDEKYFKDYLNNINISDDEALTKDYQKYYLKLSKKYEGSELDFKLKQKLYSLGYDVEKIKTIKSDSNK